MGTVSCKALPICCASTAFLSKTVSFRAVCPARQAHVSEASAAEVAELIR
eukprot:SAG22_NODE_152_length_17377_cov_191.856928_27_plen_50_part_00